MAERIHAGQVDEGGNLVVEHLGRVVGAVAAAGGDRATLMVAWLHEVGSAGVGAGDLARHAVPPAVVAVLAAVPGALSSREPTYRPGPLPTGGRAAVVLRAHYADRVRAGGLEAVDRPARVRELRRYRQLLVNLGDAAAVAAVDELIRQAEPSPLPMGLGVPRLLALLRSGDERQAAIVSALGLARDARALTALTALFTWIASKGLPGTPLHGQVYQAISQICHWPANLAEPAFRRQLVEWAGQDGEGLPRIALSALASTGDPTYLSLARRALHSTNPGLAMTAIAALPDDAARIEIPYLVQLMFHADPRWRHVRRQAIDRLARLDDPAAHAGLVQALNDPDPAVAAAAVRHLVARGDHTVVPDLIVHLQAGSAAAHMAWGLGRLRAHQATAPLTATLVAPEGQPDVAIACIDALMRIGADDITPVLASATGYASSDLRIHALRALNRLGGPEAARAALTATDDPDPGVRATAIRVLARWGDRDAVGRLCAFSDGVHASIAVTGLLRLADPSSVPTLIEVIRRSTDRRTRHLAGRAIARTGRRPWLWTHDPDPRIRRVAVWLIGQIPDPGALTSLTQALRDRDELVRARAAAALATLGDPLAAPALRQALTDPTPRVRANAATALGALGTPEVASWLANCATDPHPDVRNAAAAAAIRRLQRRK